MAATGLTIDHDGRFYGAGSIYPEYNGVVDDFEANDFCIFKYDTLSGQGSHYATVIPAEFYLTHPGVFIDDISFYNGDLYAVGRYHYDSTGLQGCLFRVDTSQSEAHDVLSVVDFPGAHALTTVADSCGSHFMMSVANGEFWYFKPEIDSIWRHENYGIGANGAASKSSHLGSIPGLRITQVQLDYADCQDRFPDLVVSIREGRPPAVRYSIDGVSFQDSPIFPDLMPGVYQVTIEDDWGCTVMSDLLTILDWEVDLDSFFTLAPSCASEEVILTLHSNFLNIEFSLDGERFFFGDTSVFLNYNGYITLYFRSRDSCITTRLIEPVRPPSPSLDSIQVLGSNCGKTDGRAQARWSDPDSVNFRLSGGRESSTGLFDSLSAGWYTMFIIYSSSGCEDSLDFEILDLDGPRIDSVQTVSATCALADGSVQVFWTAVDGIYFELNDGEVSTSGRFDDLIAGEYDIYILDSLSGCADSMSFWIAEDAIPAIDSMLIIADSCDQQTGRIEIISFSSATVSLFSLDGYNYQEERFFSNLSAGDYEVFIRDEYGCTESYQVNLPLFELGPEYTLDIEYLDDCQNGDALLRIKSSDSSLEISLDNLQYGSMYEELTSPGQYALTIVAAGRCSVDTTINLESNSLDDCGYFLPNVFSQNEDGINDIFKAFRQVSTSRYELSIFNRWGSEIYRETGLSVRDMQGWDGSYRGEILTPDVFVFRFTYRSDGGLQVLTGDVTLIR